MGDEVETQATGFRETQVYKVLEVVGKLLVPATLTTLCATALSVPARHAATAAVVLVGLTALALFRGWRFWRICVVFLVGSVSGGAATYYWQSDTAAQSARTGRGQSVAAVTIEPWSLWEQELKRKVEGCRDDACKVTAFGERPPSTGSEGVQRDRLTEDLRFGQVLMRIPPIADVMDRRFGIKDSFLGTGITQPLGSTDYGQARVAEYLVPNAKDTEPNVLTWRLTPAALTMKRTVRSLVQELQPTPPRADISRWRETIAQRLGLSEQLPAVIRISQFPPANYSGRLGRQGAARVFTLHLGQVWNLTIQELGKYSGYTLRPSASGETGTLFVWVYLPEHPDEVVTATWRSVIERGQSWIAAAN